MARETIKINFAPGNPIPSNDLNNIGKNLLYILDQDSTFNGVKTFTSVVNIESELISQMSFLDSSSDGRAFIKFENDVYIGKTLTDQFSIRIGGNSGENEVFSIENNGVTKIISKQVSQLILQDESSDARTFIKVGLNGVYFGSLGDNFVIRIGDESGDSQHFKHTAAGETILGDTSLPNTSQALQVNGIQAINSENITQLTFLKSVADGRAFINFENEIYIGKVRTEELAIRLGGSGLSYEVISFLRDSINILKPINPTTTPITFTTNVPRNTTVYLGRGIYYEVYAQMHVPGGSSVTIKVERLYRGSWVTVEEDTIANSGTYSFGESYSVITGGSDYRCTITSSDSGAYGSIKGRKY